nr:iron ABC transporter permease [Rhizobium wenxiniae]
MSIAEHNSPVLLAEAERAYHGKIRVKVMMLIILAVALCAAAVIDVCVGSSGLSPSDVLAAIFQPESVSRGVRAIVVDVRLPYSLMALLVGASLSLAGAEMQTILDNPLASPFTLGVSSAASFGAALAIVLQLGIPGLPAEWFIPANAFIFAFGSVLLLQALSGLRGAGVETLVLFGIALVFIFNALVAIMQFVASAEALQQLVFWSMGSLTRSTWTKLQIMALVMACVVPFSMAACWKLTALRLGEDRARSFGIDVTRLRFFSLLRVSILAATSVSFVGTIGFIGLVGPHIARLLVGEDHRFFLPASMLCGALVMALASAASKIIVPGVLIPVGIVTSLIGVPFFLALIFSKAGKS